MIHQIISDRFRLLRPLFDFPVSKNHDSFDQSRRQVFACLVQLINQQFRRRAGIAPTVIMKKNPQQNRLSGQTQATKLNGLIETQNLVLAPDIKIDSVNIRQNIAEILMIMDKIMLVGDTPHLQFRIIFLQGSGACFEFLRQNDFVISVGEQDVALIHQMDENASAKDLEAVAQRIEEALRVDGESSVFVGIGTLALHLRDLAKSYKEAQIAIEVGKVFDTERYVINYENLGIGRLIYQLPTTLCEMFLQEVFKKNPIDALDQETLFTIYKFFENNLNVSETARKLFVHRNTLVYRLEKIKKLTGLDLREFDDAITFKVALMVKKYLNSKPIKF